MKKSRAVSIAKFEENCINEDAVFANDSIIAVSDGAGGGGIYADKWAKYLLEHLPPQCFASFKVLDDWIDGIWEAFYKEYEKIAKEKGGLLLDKFYNEGSLATLVCVWRESPQVCQWITYGDSVAFHYNKSTGELEYSIKDLIEFNKPPYLINYIQKLQSNGYHSGTFNTDADSIVFVASDTLSHYILMQYQVVNKKDFHDELEAAIAIHSKNSQWINNSLSFSKKLYFDNKLRKLMNVARYKKDFKQYIEKLKKQKLIGHDDYSFAAFD